ncbi:piggyBac transposable element-derived protein 4 [Lates japonicus]|uniref:PiggyBac transposable element-derived protein 4 n=1 Tax=Lates japonicus TaxID=270547 RepID=A0AAD3RBX0_LATJO|nr:piggyBac transposable element-derived protein 4 [Lates japonicus]
MDYNKYMGGVGLSDQLIQYYSVCRKTNKWYRTLLWHFVDIATTNSYILYKEQCSASKKKPMSHLEFMEELAAGLWCLTGLAHPKKSTRLFASLPKHRCDGRGTWGCFRYHHRMGELTWYGHKRMQGLHKLWQMCHLEMQSL